MKRLIVILMACLALLLTSCEKPIDAREKAWRRIVDSANGSTVTFYTWLDDSAECEWFETFVKRHVNNEYGVNIEMVKLSYDQVLDILEEGKENAASAGKIDLLHLSEDEYVELKQKGLLYGPFVDKIFNYSKYYSDDDLNVIYHGAAPTNGFVVPFNVRTLSYFYDKDVVFDRLNSLESLAEFLEANPGKFTYPEPTDPIGGAFVRSVIINFSPIKAFLKDDLTEDQLAELIEPGLNYLQSLAPNLYAAGNSYPQSAEEMDQLYAEGKTLITMSYDYMYGDVMAGQSIFPYGTYPLFLMKQNVSQVSYLAIPFNAANKSGALATINDIIGSDLQIGKVYNRDYHGLPAYSKSILQTPLRSQLSQAIRKRTVGDIAMLLESGEHDIPKKYHDAIVSAWCDKIKREE